ncbi:MAG: flagellar motor switch protein FliN [Nitrospirota bacterium]|nr:flagellar motor switch protein FliN [Nitrospirota bacterium]
MDDNKGISQDEIDKLLGNIPSSAPEPAPAAAASAPPPPQKVTVAPPPMAEFAASSGGSTTAPPKELDFILDIPLRVTAQLGRTKMLIKDVLQLGPGSVIELDRLAGEPVDLMVNEKLVAKGEVVVINENFGVRLTEIITPIERINKLK